MTGRDEFQLVDESKTFNGEAQKFIGICGLSDKDYHLVAILGAQSSGKSTLLNALFGTSFQVMDDQRRAQTTHGIWMSKSAHCSTLIMDVEGTDGRERAEDLDFERKSALFSLATAEVLIINMWEHSIGLYHGANMSLLKTIMDVHLQLFKDRRSAASTVLLFVVRDFLGTTPEANLRSTIKADLQRIWESLKKPEAFESVDVESVFRLEFAFLPHKVLKPTEFVDSCSDLSRRFDTQNSICIFDKTVSAKIVPADGLSFYLESIWDQIVSNKDIDLPSQQELLAQYRCSELSQGAFEKFAASIEESKNQGIHEWLKTVTTEKCNCVDSFSSSAHRYSTTVFEKAVLELYTRLDSYILPLIMERLQTLKGQELDGFRRVFQKSKQESCEALRDKLSATQEEIISKFTEITETAGKLSNTWDFQSFHRDVATTLQQEADSFCVSRFALELSDTLQTTNQEFEDVCNADNLDSHDDPVTFLHQQLEQIVERQFARISKSALSLGVQEIDFMDEFNLYVSSALKRSLSETNCRSIVRARFNRQFKYDDSGRPRIWSTSDDVDSIFDKAKRSALEVLENLENMKISHEAVATLSVDPAILVKVKLILLSEFDMSFTEVKRSIISQNTQIPVWIYALIIILGWNEFMAIIRSPLYLLLAIILLAAYFWTRVLGLQPLVRQTVLTYTNQAMSFINPTAPNPKDKNE